MKKQHGEHINEHKHHLQRAITLPQRATPNRHFALSPICFDRFSAQTHLKSLIRLSVFIYTEYYAVISILDPFWAKLKQMQKLFPQIQLFRKT